MKRIIHATLIISTVLGLFVTSCKKEGSFELSDSVEKLTVQEVKTYYNQTIVTKEQAKNNQAAPLTADNVGIFKRMEWLESKINWNEPHQFNSGGNSYLAFTVNEKNRALKSGNKIHRTFIFSKESNQIKMQICETKASSISKPILLAQIKTALENHEMHKESASSTGTASLYFYDEDYRSGLSCKFTDGKFEYTSETITLRVVKDEKNVESRTYNENGPSCELWGVIHYYWENGELFWEIESTWQVCTPGYGPGEEEMPEGGGGGGDGSPDLPAGAKLDQWIVEQNAYLHWTVYSTEKYTGIRTTGPGGGYFLSNSHQSDHVVNNGTDFVWTRTGVANNYSNSNASTQISGAMSSVTFPDFNIPVKSHSVSFSSQF